MSIFEKLNIDDELRIPVYSRAGEDGLTVGRVVYIHPKKRMLTQELYPNLSLLSMKVSLHMMTEQSFLTKHTISGEVLL